MENISTSCCNCVFSATKGITQNGCHLGRIDKLRQQGVKVTEAYDQDKEFYLLENYLCLAARQRSWLEKVEDPIEKVYDEIALKMESVIPIYETTMEDVEKTAKWLSEQTFKPGKAHFILNQDGIPIDHLIKMLNKYNILFEVNMVANPRPQIFQTLNNIVNEVNSSYYIELKTGKYFPPTIFEYVNKLLNYDLERFVAIQSYEHPHCTIIQTTAHKMLGGHNYYLDVIDKLNSKANEHKNEKYIKLWEEGYNICYQA